MFIKAFCTIFLVLFFMFILQRNITAENDAPISVKLTMKLITWFIQATIGANIVVFIYRIWS